MTVKSIARSVGIASETVLAFSLLLAFVLYLAAQGSLVKYKEYLF